MEPLFCPGCLTRSRLPPVTLSVPFVKVDPVAVSPSWVSQVTMTLTPADSLLAGSYFTFFDLSCPTLLRSCHQWCLNVNIPRSLNPLTVYYWPISPEPRLLTRAVMCQEWRPLTRARMGGQCHSWLYQACRRYRNVLCTEWRHALILPLLWHISITPKRKTSIFTYIWHIHMIIHQEHQVSLVLNFTDVNFIKMNYPLPVFMTSTDEAIADI